MFHNEKYQNVLAIPDTLKVWCDAKDAQRSIMASVGRQELKKNGGTWYYRYHKTGKYIAITESYYDPLFRVRAMSVAGNDCGGFVLFDQPVSDYCLDYFNRGQERAFWVTRVWLNEDTTADYIILHM